MKKVLLSLLVLATVYGLAAFGLAVRAAGQNAAFNAQLDRLKQLGDTAAKDLAAEPAQTLAVACKALPEVESRTVAAYFAKSTVDTKDLGLFPQVAIQNGGETANWPWNQQDWQSFMYELLSDVPSSWHMYLDYWDDPFNHELSDVKYLVVHLLMQLKRPRVLTDDTYEAGALTFHSAVLDGQTGKVLCAGSTVVSDTRDIKVTGHGATGFDAREDADRKRDEELLSDLAFAGRHFGQGELCWLGGKSLCDATFRPFARPE